MTVRSTPVVLERRGPWAESRTLGDTRDPCPVFDGYRWHLFGTADVGAAVTGSILHAVAYELEGPWRELAPSTLIGVEGEHVAAPGMIHERDRLHMFVPTEGDDVEVRVEHLVSMDGGLSFVWLDSAMEADASTGATISDPHPASVGVGKYLVHSIGVGGDAPSVHLARSASGTWEGPWERLGPLRFEADSQAERRSGDADHVCRPQGAQVVPLPDGRVLLNAVCRVRDGSGQARQHAYFAMADDVRGPYRSLGTAPDPSDAGAWEPADNGHAAAFVVDGELVLFYRARPRGDAAAPRHGVIEFRLTSLPLHHVTQRRVSEIELVQLEMARR